MKQVKSFSLDSVVAAAVDDIPRNERSRRINQILREALLQEKQENVSVSQIKDIIQSMMKNSPEEKVDNDKAKNALNSIIGMRKGKL